jgi:mannose-6-phosphate isomerase-like protein (cupin superfamily)
MSALRMDDEFNDAMAAALHTTRRRALQYATSTAWVSMFSIFTEVHGLDRAGKHQYTFRYDREDAGVIHYKGVHNGNGAIDIKFFFQEDRAANPALLIMYDIPPGASEGVHTHNFGDKKAGSFDEFYYILSGSGQMQIAGESVWVRAGDHLFTPNGVPHGIENIGQKENLRVYLVAVVRE